MIRSGFANKAACQSLLHLATNSITRHSNPIYQQFRRNHQTSRTSSHPSSSDLADLNSATLGTEMPVITLPSGEQVQTGTVGALLLNIVAYDKAIDSLESTTSEEAKRKLRTEVERYEQTLMAPMPLLQKVGLFQLFRPEEWIQGGSPGRRFVGRCALEAGL